MNKPGYIVSGAWSDADSIDVTVYNNTVSHLHRLQSELVSIDRENRRAPAIGLFYVENKVYHPTLDLRREIIQLEGYLMREEARLRSLSTSAVKP